MGDGWISTWAIRASGVAATAGGDFETGNVTLQRVLQGPLNPVERARTLLYLGENLVGCGELAEARAVLTEADQLFEDMDARYWRAKTLYLMAQADPAAGAGLTRRPRALADGDPS